MRERGKFEEKLQKGVDVKIFREYTEYIKKLLGFAERKRRWTEWTAVTRRRAYL